MPRYGIIDLGSNTIRLCIYETPSEKKNGITRKEIQVLLNYKIMAGLASFVKESRKQSIPSMLIFVEHRILTVKKSMFLPPQ